MKKLFVAFMGAALLAAGPAMASEKAHWGYSGHGGPENWGELSEAYALCGTGKNQSPINLTSMIEAELAGIDFNYNGSPLEVVNNGHAIQVNYAPGSSMTVNGHTYNLLQYHFHTPSENQIEGVSFPVEAHLVHADADGNLAVVAVMFKDGGANSYLAPIWDHMPVEAGQTEAVSDVSLNVMDMLPANKDYYRFNGSLTTPPCTEGVLWLVLKDAVEVSHGQVEKFHGILHHDNNRPVQAVNARPVLK